MATVKTIQDATQVESTNPLLNGVPSAYAADGLIRSDEQNHFERFTMAAKARVTTVLFSIANTLGIELKGSEGLNVFNIQVDTSKGKGDRPVTLTSDVEERQEDGESYFQFVTTIVLHLRNLLDSAGQMIDVEALESVLIMSVAESISRARQAAFITKDGRNVKAIAKGVMVGDSGKWNKGATEGLAPWFSLNVLESSQSWHVFSHMSPEEVAELKAPQVCNAWVLSNESGLRTACRDLAEAIRFAPDAKVDDTRVSPVRKPYQFRISKSNKPSVLAGDVATGKPMILRLLDEQAATLSKGLLQSWKMEPAGTSTVEEPEEEDSLPEAIESEAAADEAAAVAEAQI